MIEHVFLLLMGFERSYSTPTSSMQPTLMIGDVYPARTLRLYGMFGPVPFAPVLERGDIVIYETSTHELWCKRIVAMGGDRVQMKHGRLVINDRPVERHPLGRFEDSDSAGAAIEVTRYEETLPNGASYLINEISDDQPLDNTEVFVVPAGHLFTLGDNRDRSADSRVMSMVGYVPLEAAVAVLKHDEPMVFWARAPH